MQKNLFPTTPPKKPGPKPVTVEAGQRDPINDAEFKANVEPYLLAIPPEPTPPTSDPHKAYLYPGQIERMLTALSVGLKRETDRKEESRYHKILGVLRWMQANGRPTTDGRIELHMEKVAFDWLIERLTTLRLAGIAWSIGRQIEVW